MTKFKEWLKSITFYEILIGMKTTLKHLLHYRPITLQYPYEKRVLPDNYRGMLALLRCDDGTEKCVGCDLCEAACPSRVISVTSEEVPGEPTKRYARAYTMDMTRCLFCGMCVQACPVDALGMTREYEWSVYDKRDLLLNKQQLLAIGDRSFPVREKRLEFQHPNVAVFNVAFHNHPPRTSDQETEPRRRNSEAIRSREEQIRAMDSKLLTLVNGEHKLTTAEVMDSGTLERPSPSVLDTKLFNKLVLTLNGTHLPLPLLRRRDFNGPSPHYS